MLFRRRRWQCQKYLRYRSAAPLRPWNVNGSNVPETVRSPFGRERPDPLHCCRSAQRREGLQRVGTDRSPAAGAVIGPNLDADSLTCLRVPPPPNVKFRGTADSRLRN